MPLTNFLYVYGDKPLRNLFCDNFLHRGTFEDTYAGEHLLRLYFRQPLVVSSNLYFVTMQLILAPKPTKQYRDCVLHFRTNCFQNECWKAKKLSRANPMDKMVACSCDLVVSPSISEKDPDQLNSFTIQLADETWLHVFSHLSQQDLCQVARVSTRFKRLALDPSLWQKEILQLFRFWNEIKFAYVKSHLKESWLWIHLSELTKQCWNAVLLLITIILLLPRYFNATDNGEKKQNKCLPT